MNNNFIRSNQNNKNRNRNRNRRPISSGGGGGGGNGSNKVFDSNGPDIKLRGTTQTIAEKYMQLGRDAQSSGDSVAAENYYQHAEHYYRLWAASQPVGHSLQMSRKLGEEEFEEESDDSASGEDEAEGGTMEAAPAEANQQLEGGAVDPNAPQGEGQQRQNRNNNYRDNNNRDNNNRNFRPRWPNNRNNRNFDNREGGAASEQGAGLSSDAPVEMNQVESPAPAPVPMDAEAGGQWEAPSFLQRPTPAMADAPEVASEDAPAPRKYKPRKPRVEADAPGDEGSNSVE